jgi:DNA-binding response OmpR family regulator
MTDTVKKPIILLVDDDPDFLFQLKHSIEKAGFIVAAQESQEDAEFWLRKNKPDLAIFDLMMERDDSGFVLAYHAKKAYPDVPVILLTAVTAETGRNFGMEPGDQDSWIKADLYLEKGLHHENLIGHIHSLLNL